MDNAIVSRGRRLFLALAALVAAGACGKQIVRTLVQPKRVQTLDKRSPWLKAHLADGRVYVLSQWHSDSAGTEIVGNGMLLDANRVRIDSGRVTLPVDSVALFETNVEEHSGAFAGLTIMTGITAIVAGICAASPKTCFGSCPTFYAPGPDGAMELQAEAFSASIAPGLEATDVDMLLHARPAARDFTLRLTNEAFETHVIRHADLLAARRPAGGRVYQTSAGIFRDALDPVRPSRCMASEGDCRALLAAADGRERTSAADSTDLATREIVELEFDDVPDGALGLVLVSRQTLMTTYLLYQELAYMGTDAGRWLARLGAGDKQALSLAGAVARTLGDIEVLAPDSGGTWRRVGEVGETGPIAVDTRVVPIPRPASSPVRLRLRLTAGLWRLDQAALVSLGDTVVPERIPPTSVRRGDVADPSALRGLTDPDRTLVTFPGDVYQLTYHLPGGPADYELFLEARGYYLEWMRREWLAEENPMLAARMLLDPAGAMRDLAPAFKKVEPRIEHLFWSSRYVH